MRRTSRCQTGELLPAPPVRHTVGPLIVGSAARLALSWRKEDNERSASPLDRHAVCGGSRLPDCGEARRRSAASLAASDVNPPRCADGKPDLQGIWQAHNRAWGTSRTMTRGRGFRPARGSRFPRRGAVPAVGVKGKAVPYQAWAHATRVKRRTSATLDPLMKCNMPGIPRATYMNLAFQIIRRRNTSP